MNCSAYTPRLLAAAALVAVLGPATAANLTVVTGPVIQNGLSANATPSSTSSTDSRLNGVSSLTSSVFREEIVTPPTTTSAGLVKVYEDTTITNTFHWIDYQTDSFRWSATATSMASYGGSYITLNGMFTSASADPLQFSLVATGSYIPVLTPFGSSAPSLTSLYIQTAGGSAVQLPSSSSLNPSSNTYQIESGDRFTPTANTLTSFSAIAYAPVGVALSDFSLTISQDYNFTPRTEIRTFTSTQFVDARAINPVPEPETYALMLAGLGVVGTVARCRKQAA